MAPELLGCPYDRPLEQALRQAGKKDARLSISACTASYTSTGAGSDAGVQHAVPRASKKMAA